MTNNNKEEVIVVKMEKPKKKRNRTKNRFTTMVRLDRHLKDAVKCESKRTGEPISQIMDWAVEEYLDSVKSLD